MKKYELIQPHPAIREQIKMDRLIEYIEKILNENILKDHFLSFSLTFFFCNCVANLNADRIFFSTKHEFYMKHVMYIYKQIYEKINGGSYIAKLDQLKIKNDIKFIIQHRMLLHINSLRYTIKKLYLFFFQNNIYIVEKI